MLSRRSLRAVRSDGVQIWETNLGKTSGLAVGFAVLRPKGHADPSFGVLKQFGHKGVDGRPKASIFIIDHLGKQTSKLDLDTNFYNIEPVEWPKPGNMFVWAGSEFIIVDPVGKVWLRAQISDSISTFSSNVISVQLETDGDPYLAVLARGSSQIDRSQLTIFNPDGNVIYKEIMKKCIGLLPLKESKTAAESILIYEKGTLWAYSLSKK